MQVCVSVCMSHWVHSAISRSSAGLQFLSHASFLFYPLFSTPMLAVFMTSQGCISSFHFVKERAGERSEGLDISLWVKDKTHIIILFVSVWTGRLQLFWGSLSCFRLGSSMMGIIGSFWEKKCGFKVKPVENHWLRIVFFIFYFSYSYLCFVITAYVLTDAVCKADTV